MFLNKILINSVSFIRASNLKTFCTATKTTLNVECLRSRSILKVSGEETSVFLQGLVTNDVRHLEEGACSMYTMFLNTKGRVMYDAIIYKTPDQHTLLVECDSAALEPLQKHLTMFRIRRKVKIESLSNTVGVWVLFKPVSECTTKNLNDSKSNSTVTCSSSEETEVLQNPCELPADFACKHSLTTCRDPRLAALGIRIIAPKSKDLIKIASKELGATPITDERYGHKVLRYRLGVGEGVEDLPPGKCFPLEANCDYLHGVSFHKGCYIGQELTARTHHTGVVRKRLMPIDFGTKPTTGFVPDAPIQHCDNSKSALGKLRGVEDTAGLALLRIVEALSAPSLKVLDTTAYTKKPNWWPQEATKDRIAVGKDATSN